MRKADYVILLLAALLCVGACSSSPVSPAISGPSVGDLMGRPYPERWMSRAAVNSGYDCFRCHEVLPAPERRQ